MSKIVDYVSEDNKNDMLNDVRDSDYDAFVNHVEGKCKVKAAGVILIMMRSLSFRRYLNLMYSVLFIWKGRRTGLSLIL